MTSATNLRTVKVAMSNHFVAKRLMSWIQILARGWKLGLSGGSGNANRQMRVVETLAIGPKKHLILVSCGQQRFLIGTGADSVQTIVLLGPELGDMTANNAAGCAA